MEDGGAENKIGTKETEELIALIQAAADAIKAAKADGEINWRDIPKVGGVLVALKAAAQGNDKVPAELKDLTREEIEKLMAKSMTAILAMIQAFVE